MYRPDAGELRHRGRPTTVDPDKAAIAERAVERIAERITGGPDGTAAIAKAVEIVTPFRLEVRESTVGVRLPAPPANGRGG